MRILARIKEKCSLKEAYSLYVSDAGENTEGEMVMNRVKLRKYLKELYYYQSVVMKNKDIV